MGAVGVQVSRPLALALAPVLVRQGRQVRERTPVLPEAAGDRSGVEPAGPAGRDVPPLGLVVVGESTAAGVGVSDQRQGVARQLAAEVARRRGLPVAWTVCARTGATAGHTARELVPSAPVGQDLAVVVLGVNDALRFRSRRAWRGRVVRVLDALGPHLAPGGRVVLAGVPDLGSFPALPQPLRAVLGWHARSLDRQLRRLAAQRPGVLHVPGPPLTGEGLFAADGFHPSAYTYARWAAHLADAVA
ncbi:SGNH/GDSL hydrolase family protein [Geodermatophilus sp. DSM 45219]|uniref:SGNH/GDSL hydrolase family protein n=1 Tax=Geodermatophilus sp. DSM 45219 TaxID=1881103 RepID=UPI00087F8723|nr:SGNH/GDSL hydrolase family protein [Geodermatophilus sp. DSM 45219]SDO07249.1 Lysophospholipase L1 [Geodermatophilus sp. DSM 45219]